MGKSAAAGTIAPLASIQSQVEFITPQIAATMLASNTRNRALSKGSVTAYAEDMANGRWQLNGDAIRFSSEGTLLDGQHRLQAVIEAGVGVAMLIIRNLPPETFATIDAGRKRTAGDILNLEGFGNYNALASAARGAILYAGGFDLARTVSRIAITDFVVAHPYLTEATKMATSHHGPLNASPLAAVIFLANERRLFDDDVDTYLSGISSGTGLEARDPRLALREWAFNQRQKRGGTIAPHMAFYACARAWTAHVRGEQLGHIKVLARPSRATVQIAGFHADDEAKAA